MSSNIRPSILLRPKKPSPDPSNTSVFIHTAGSARLEYEREQQSLEKKRQQRAQREHVRGQELWGDKQDKAELAARARAEHDRFIASRREVAERERADAMRVQQEALQREEQSRREEQARIEAKKAYLAQLRDENNRLAEQRRAAAAAEHQQDQARMKQHYQESTFLDRFGRHAY